MSRREISPWWRVASVLVGSVLGSVLATALFVDHDAAPVVVERTIDARPDVLDADAIPVVVDGALVARCDFDLEWDRGAITLSSGECTRTETNDGP